MRTDVAVVGGGLAGLAAASLLARAGRSVTLIERSSRLGGRAISTRTGEYALNLGPHALYLGGAAARVLRKLGVTYAGGAPPVSGGYALRAGVRHTLPVGSLSLLTTGLLRPAEKLEAGRFLAKVGRFDPAPLAGVSVADWLARSFAHAGVRELIAAFLRLSTYAHDPARQGAGAALAQLQLGVRPGVLYVDGGWQSLVDALRDAAREAGVCIETRREAARVEPDGAVVHLQDGGMLRAHTVIVTGSPGMAHALVPESGALAAWTKSAIPVRAACLDVALTRLPRPKARFALGLDAPLYFSVQSASARLAPPLGAVIHAARYLGAEPPSDAAAVEAELEGVLDTLQAGWRAHVAHRRFLPDMVVSHALVTADAGGLAGRPGPWVPDAPGVLVAGDWVGPEGQLADASLASAHAAAQRVLGAARPELTRAAS